MQPKRSKLFPIGNTFSNVGDGRLKEVFQSSPQTLHHFTRFDQVDQLVGASEADPDLGFMVRLLVVPVKQTVTYQDFAGRAGL